MRIELLGHAPDVATMRAFFKAVNWAEWIVPKTIEHPGYWRWYDYSKEEGEEDTLQQYTGPDKPASLPAEYTEAWTETPRAYWQPYSWQIGVTPKGNPIMAHRELQIDVVGPIVEWDHSDPENPVKTKDTGGVHFNVRFYGTTAENTVKAFQIDGPKDENGNPTKTWDFAKISAALEGRIDVKKKFALTQKTAEGVKEGYKHPTGVTLFDPATIKKRNRVWA